MTPGIGNTVAAAIAAGPHRMTVGLRPLPLAQWIDDSGDVAQQLRERAVLLRERSDVVRALPGCEAAQREVLALLIDHLRAHFPERYAFSAAGEPARITVKATGQTLSLDVSGNDHAHAGNDRNAVAMHIAGHLVAEDLCLLQADGEGKYRLHAAALCFPTRWKLADKLGQALMAIHAPVPGYARAVGVATDRVMSALDPARPLWRQNWSLLDSPTLYQPERLELQQALTADDLGRRLWMRCERQTLRRLPQSGAVLFGIRIQQCTLDALCREPGAAARLLSQLETMPSALKAYKGLDQIDAILCDFLRAASRVSIDG